MTTLLMLVANPCLASCHAACCNVMLSCGLFSVLDTAERFPTMQVQWLFGQCLSVLQERGADMAEFDRDADLLQMLLYY